MSESERFRHLAASQDWHTIDELVTTLDRAGFWNPALLTVALAAYKKSLIRRWIKHDRTADGYPAWESIVQPGADGEPRRVYKQEPLFSLEDYRQSIQAWVDRSEYAAHRARDLSHRAFKRYQVQLLFPWEVDDAAR